MNYLINKLKLNLPTVVKICTTMVTAQKMYVCPV